MRFGRTGIATLVATVATTALWADDAPAGDHPLEPPAPRRAEERAASSPRRRAARRAEELVGTFGLRWWRDLRAQAVASLDRAATAAFGPLDRARAAELGRRAWFEDADVDVFVIGPVDDLEFVAVPVGTTVTEHGEVLVPPPDDRAYTTPSFGGPWGTSTTASSPRSTRTTAV